MLNIDYSNSRKFLMSLGITMIFFSIFLTFVQPLILRERFDSVVNTAAKLPEDGLIKEYGEGFIKEAEEVIFLSNILIKILFIGGWILFIIGIILWGIKKK